MKLKYLLSLLVLLFTAFAHANPELLKRATLKFWEETEQIDVRGYKRIFIGVISGRINCYYGGSLNWPAVVVPYFGMGSSWFEQKTCGDRGTSPCNFSAKEGESQELKPQSSIMKFRIDYIKVSQHTGANCQSLNPVTFEVWGHK